MIFSSIVHLLTSLFNFILNFFPDADISAVTAIASTVQNLINPIASFNWIFPAEEFVIQVTFLIHLVGIVLLVKLTRWILSILTGGIFK